MKKSFFKRLLTLLLLSSLLTPLAKAQQADQHMLWKIEKGGELQGYLLGSVHLMKPEVYPLDKTYQKAFKQADLVVFELNFDSLKTNMLPLVQKLAMYPPGKSVKGVLSTESFKLLKNTLDSLGLPAARFSRFEPWYIAMSIPALRMRQAGYTGTAGIDMHFFNKAQKTDKKVIGLETAAYQLNIFDDLSPKLQEKYLTYVLKHSDETLSKVNEIVSAWINGNADKIEDIMQGEMKTSTPKLYKKLLTQRNKNWIPKIQDLLIEDQIPLIVVGAGHMVGKNGLISLLENKGYAIEQL